MVDEHTIIYMPFDSSLTEIKGRVSGLSARGHGPISLATNMKKVGAGSAQFNPPDFAGNTSNIGINGVPSMVNNFTVEAWVYCSSSLWENDNNTICICGTSYYGDNIFYVTDKRIQFFYRGQAEYSSVSQLKGMLANKWVHLAACKDSSGNIYGFVNGVRCAYQSAISDSTTLTEGYLQLGAGLKRPWYMLGYIDEFRVSNICRYTSNFTPPTQPFDITKGLIKSTQPINLLDKTSITGIDAEGIEPSGTSRRLIFQVDGTWNKLTTDGAGAATLTAVTTQAPTVDSVLSEGNTVAELNAVTSVPGFVGKLIYPAAALYAGSSASVMPTLGLTIDGEIDTTVNVYEYTDYSQEYVLGDTDVVIVSAVAETTATGSGAVNITARLYQNGEWGEYTALNAVQMQQASKIQLKAVYTVQTTDGSDSVHIDAVTITYNTAGAVVSDATTDIVTVTERFENDLAYVHAYAKHERLIDAEIEAYCSLRKQPHQRAMYQVGNGTGALATYQLPDTGVNQDTLQVYVDGKPNYDFGYNTETSQITVTADLGAVVSASYEYGWEPSTWVRMTKGSTQVNDSGRYTTEYTYVIPTHSETYTVTAVKYSLVRPEGTVTNETIGVGTGKRQIIQLPHYAKTETIVCNGSWSYNYDGKQLTIIAPEGDDIVISYDWIAETPHVYGIAAGWAETIE